MSSRDEKTRLEMMNQLCFGFGPFSNVANQYSLPLGHPSPGGFENFLLARSEAVDSVRGDFVEDWIHFLADEFLRRHFTRARGFTPGPPLRDLCRGLDELPFASA